MKFINHLERCQEMLDIYYHADTVKFFSFDIKWTSLMQELHFINF